MKRKPVLIVLAVAAALCLLLWLPLRHHWRGGIPLVCGFVGLVFTLLNGIPMKVGGIDNDGRNALSLRKSKTALYAFWLQMKKQVKMSLLIWKSFINIL